MPDKTLRRSPNKKSNLNSESNDENYDCTIQPSSNQFSCNVRNCQNKSYYTYFELIKHIQEFHTANLAQNQLENKPTSDLIICPWENCFFEGNLVQMRVHLYYHARLCMLKDIGQTYISKKDLPICGIADKSLNCSDSSIYNKYQCKWEIENEKVCGVEFENCSAFYQHVQDHAYNFNFDENCKFFYPDGYRCNWHGCQATPKRSFAKLCEHINSHTNKKEIACPECSTQFCSTTRLNDHLINQSKLDKFSCSLCNKTFSSNRLLTNHLRKHLFTKKCPHCEITLSCESAIKRHMEFKHQDKIDNLEESECYICKKIFKTHETLISHFKYAHFDIERDYHSSKMKSNDPITYLCIKCDFVSSNSRQMTKHQTKFHDLTLPGGFTRFQYRKNETGFYQVVTERYEKIDVP